MIKRIGKIAAMAVLATTPLSLKAAPAYANVINFDNATNIAGPFPSGTAISGVEFREVTSTSPNSQVGGTIGSNLKIVPASPGVTPAWIADSAPNALGVNSLGTSGVLITWLPAMYPNGIIDLSFKWTHDSSANPFAKLVLFDGQTQADVLSGAATALATIIARGDNSSLSPFETISYDGLSSLYGDFNMALFVDGNYSGGTTLTAGGSAIFAGYGLGGGTWTSGSIREDIDTIRFDQAAAPAPEGAPVPEVQTYASLFGAALIGIQVLRRRRNA